MRQVLSLSLVLLIGGIAVGEKVSAKVSNVPGFLAVDANGDLIADEAQAGTGEIKVSLNTKNGKFKETGKGQTTNASGKSQTYDNPPELSGEGFEGAEVTYKVKKSGAARFKAAGIVPPDEIDELADLIRALGNA